MKNDINPVANGHMLPARIKISRADLCTLPVASIRNTCLSLPVAEREGAADEELFYDALDTQPWLTPASAHWPLLSSLASQVKEAIHHQLHLLSQTTLASNLLHVLHPDLSKLLAAVLICSRQGKNIVWLAGFTGGLELINKLIYLVAGATSTAALLTTLPALLSIWLFRQHITLTETALHTVSLLLATGLTICAQQDFAQPGWLVALYEQVIAPVMQVCSETGITETVTTGITLILAAYTMLRITGWTDGKRPPVNVFTYGIKIIQDICNLSAESHDYQRLYQIKHRQALTKTWYEHAHHKPWEESKANKALNRSVIRCMNKEVLMQKDRQLTGMECHQSDSLRTERFYQAYQQTEQQILSGKLTTCPQGQREMLPPGNRDRSAIPANTVPPAASSAADASAPLLISGASVVIAAAAVQNPWCKLRTNLLLAASGITLLAGARYLHSSLSDAATSSTTKRNALSENQDLCADGTDKIRKLLHSDKTEAPLAIDLFDYLFDDYGDINIIHADRLLAAFDITTFKSSERNEMNQQLLHLLSLLLRPAGRKEPVDISSIIISMGNKINIIWIYFIKNKKNSSARTILHELRLHCNKEYLSMNIFTRLKMHKITDFLISQVAPDLLFLERNGRENEKILSKNVYYLWNYIGKIFTENKHIRNNDFSSALALGQIDGLITARLRSYASYNLTEDREYLEEVYKDLNKEMYAYHKYDVELEGVPIGNFDDIISNAFPELDIEAEQNFDTIHFRIITQGQFSEDIRRLSECRSFRDLIRNFNDGFKVLHHYLPMKVPESLRLYDSSNKRIFSLKKHPTLPELYKKFDQTYQEMVDYHCSLYKEVVDRACEISSEEECSFLKNTNTEIYAIDAEVKRLKTLRYTLQSVLIKFNRKTIERTSYNLRPYHEIGKIFFGYNRITKEKRYYAIHIEASRMHPGHYPLQRLLYNQTEDIFKAGNGFLDENYLFMDQQSFFDPCDDIKQPTTNLLSRLEESGVFFTEHYEYYKNKLCHAVRSPKEIVVTYHERRLGDKNNVPLDALKKEMTENRRKLLFHLKSKAHDPTAVELTKEKGKAMTLIESFPFYNCYELFRDIFYTRQDISPPSPLIPVFQLTICAADFYMGYGLKKTLTTLMQSLRKIYTLRWIRRSELSSFNLQLSNNIAMSSSDSNTNLLIEKIKFTQNSLKAYDDEITQLRFKLQTSLGNLFSMPVYVKFPYLSLRSGEDFLVSNIPWGIGLAKMFIKKAYSLKKNAGFQAPWHNPTAAKSVENEKYILPQPSKSNFTCHADSSQADNVILDIFDLNRTNSTLYQKLFFTALRDPNVESVIDAAKNAGWTIPDNYNQMAMFCFISLTISVRWLTSSIMTQQKHYKKDKNDIKITEEALYQYYHDYQLRSYISLPVTMQSDQNIFISESLRTIKALLTSNIQGIELNYLFMIQYLLMNEDSDALSKAIAGSPIEQKHQLDIIQQNLDYNLDRFTIYASSHFSMQKKFHTAVVQQFCHISNELISSNPANITLFSPNIETFLQRAADFRVKYPDATLPSLASFTTNWQRIARSISDIYLPLVRIEFSAQVLADYPVSKWREETALNAWRDKLQQYLFPEMHFEKITPVLQRAAQQLGQSWQQRLSTSGNRIKIIDNGVVNSLFIDDVREALTKSCARYPELFFCQVYQRDNGHWFTFLINDFMSDSYHRSKRQLADTDPSWPVSPLVSRLPKASDLLQEASITTNVMLNQTSVYQQQLQALVSLYSRARSLPFHQRLQQHALDDRPPVNSPTAQDVVSLFNDLIDVQGNIVDYQYRALSHYLPLLDVQDDYLLLQLLSDTLRLTMPESPDLYEFIVHSLQNNLADPAFRLASLTQQNFVGVQITEIVRRFTLASKQYDSAVLAAIRRYITATVRHLLSFTAYLSDIEPLLAQAPLHSLSSQWLCLGAIICRQLNLVTSTAGELLMLASAAQHDTGLLSLRETAIQQLAFLSGCQPVGDRRAEALDALKTVSSTLLQADAMQQRVFSCLEASHWLALFLAQMNFSSPGDWDALRTLLSTALQEQRKLLQHALFELTDEKNLQLTQAIYRGELQLTWYRQESNLIQQGQVAGLAFNIKNQHGIILPLGEPESVPPIFRQLTATPDAHELTRLCFADADNDRLFLDPIQLNLTIGTYSVSFPVTNPAIVLFEWMQSEAVKRLATLEKENNETSFNQAKQSLITWLSQHLFFYDNEKSYYSSLPEKTEHIARAAAHPDIAKWQRRDPTTLVHSDPVSRFSHAISTVMGGHTLWPSMTAVLRATAPRTGATPWANLPEQGFAGFWWDPVSRFCYLGWKNGESRALYASTADNREALYLLADDAINATIWPDLTYFDWLQNDVQALRRAAISVRQFFDESIALAWQLQRVLIGGIPLPDGSVIQRPGLPLVVIRSENNQQRDYFYPAGAELAVPVTVTRLTGGGWRLDFSPHNAQALQDNYLSLETNQIDITQGGLRRLSGQPAWQLISAADADEISKQGIFTPASYLHWNGGSHHTTTMVPISRVLQRNDGSLVFIFIENDQRLSYRMLDTSGELQPSPALPADWPRDVSGADTRQRNAAINQLITRQKAPDYRALLEPDEQLRLENVLSGAQQYRRAAISQAYSQHRAFLFRSAFSKQAQSELEDILLAFLRMRQNFWQRVKINAQLEDTPLSLDELLWKPYAWRDYNLFSHAGCDSALEKLQQEKTLLHAMRQQINLHHDVRLTSDDLKAWIAQRLTMLDAAVAAIPSIKSQQHSQPDAMKTILPLQLQRFAHNYFFGYYDRQLYVTAELFQQPWPCIRDTDWPGAARNSWQPALDLLHTLVTEMPPQVRIADRLLTLPEPLWRADEMQQRARSWQQTCQQGFRYWQTARSAEQMLLLRPAAATQEPQLMSQRYRWPVRLVLAAGIGDPDNNQSAGTAPPLQIGAQHNEDLLLTPPGPAISGEPSARLAAINADPQNARQFADWSKLRLSSPWALQAFSGPEFLLRLHGRIQRVMAQEADSWCQEEQEFYRSPAIAEFLQQSQPELIDKSHYAALFIQLFNSNLLVTRLIMTDAEMVFGLMCDYFVEKHPERASEDLSKAWFLFLHTFDQPEQDDRQPLWLVGV